MGFVHREMGQATRNIIAAITGVVKGLHADKPNVSWGVTYSCDYDHIELAAYCDGKTARRRIHGMVLRQIGESRLAMTSLLAADTDSLLKDLAELAPQSTIERKAKIVRYGAHGLARSIWETMPRVRDWLALRGELHRPDLDQPDSAHCNATFLSRLRQARDVAWNRREPKGSREEAEAQAERLAPYVP